MNDPQAPSAAPVEDNRLRAQLAEAEASHAGLLKQKTELEKALTRVRSEKEALERKLHDLDAELGETLVAAAESAAAHRAATAELSQRVAHLERDLAARPAREATQPRERSPSKNRLSERIAALEAEKEALVQKLSAAETRGAARPPEREAPKTRLSGRIAGLEAEKQALAQKLSAAETREAAWLREREASKSKLSGRIAGLALEREALIQKLSVAESDRDSAVSEAARREETQSHAIAEQRARAERLEAESAAHKEFEARLTEEGSRLRAGLVEQISRLEAEAGLAQKTFAELLARKAEDERALVQARGDVKEASQRLAEVERGHARVHGESEARFAKIAGMEKDHSMALAEARGREDALREAMDVERQRAVQLEQDIEDGSRLRAGLAEQISRAEAEGERALVRVRGEAKEASEALAEAERGHALALAEALRAHGDLRVSLSEQIARTEAAVAAREGAQAELAAQKTEGDKTLESVQAESEARRSKVAEMAKDHTMALAEAAQREDALRQFRDAERERVVQLEKDIGAFIEGEAKRIGEWETSREEWSQRIRLLEDAAALSGTAHANLLAREKEGEEALASLRADRETLVTRLSETERERDQAQAQVARLEAAGDAGPEGLGTLVPEPTKEGAEVERESTRPEAWEAARTKLLARIARLEANEALTDKARSELVSRKRDSDRALAAAQTEREALLKKLAMAERDRDQG